MSDRTFAMDEDVVTLIEEARRFDTAPAGYASRLQGAHDLIDRLAAALAARPLPETEEWEYGILHDGHDEWGTTVPTLVEARGLLDTEPCAACVIVRRRPERSVGPWEPAPSAALTEEEGR